MQGIDVGTPVDREESVDHHAGHRRVHVDESWDLFDLALIQSRQMPKVRQECSSPEVISYLSEM